ncbi:PREDICTED: uncharacterized protein LOC109477654 [Branchiostoma belcheri]|uniref:Uncharacterized protein LOC109477654 n=1 Tax=Branchiostoma belcheri TaxID=7741 RepID=A0A6P4ZCZ8_BRABE|nr:PREDICTED: uncharacterized protein LOC109477654 [Branchiostoma belcheri]
MSGAKPQKNKGSDVDTLLQLTSKLQDATSTYEAVVRDMAKLKEENSVLREKNSDLSRMNDQLRMELNKRTPQKYGRYTVATLEAKVAQYEKENAQFHRALERSDKYTEELEKRLQDCKKKHSLQNEQRICKETSKFKTPELDEEDKCPTERKWNQGKLDQSREHQVSVSSSERRHLPDPELSPISRTLQFMRNPAGGSNDLVPSWLRTDQNWPEAEPKQPEASPNRQGNGDSFVLEQPSPLTPATHMRHLSIGHKSESLSQNRMDTDTSYKNEDTYGKRTGDHSHSSRSSNNSGINVSSNQHGGSYVANDRPARLPSPVGQSEGSVTSSGKARRKLNLGNDGERVKKSLFPPRETNTEEQTFSRYTSQEARDASNSSSSTGSWTDKASTSNNWTDKASTSNNWKQNRSGSSGKKDDLLLGSRDRSGQFTNRPQSLSSEQLTKNYNGLNEKGRETSILQGPSRPSTSASLNGQEDTKKRGKSFQWLAESPEGSDDEDREVASTTANQSLLDLDITLTPNMKDVYMMMKQAERRVGERREVCVDLSKQRPSSHDGRGTAKDFDVGMPQETSRQKTGTHFEPKPKMPRSSSAPVLENTGSGGSISQKPDVKNERRRNMSQLQSTSLWQSSSTCGSTTNNVQDYNQMVEQEDKTYTTDKDKLTRNRSWDREYAGRHTEANAITHPWAFRDSSSSFHTAEGDHTFSRGRVTQGQTQVRVPEIKKPMHPTMFECFGEGPSSDRSTDSDVGRSLSGYSGVLDRENEGENVRKRKPRESYLLASPSKSPKWK